MTQNLINKQRIFNYVPKLENSDGTPCNDPWAVSNCLFNIFIGKKEGMVHQKVPKKKRFSFHLALPFKKTDKTVSRAVNNQWKTIRYSPANRERALLYLPIYLDALLQNKTSDFNKKFKLCRIFIYNSISDCDWLYKREHSFIVLSNCLELSFIILSDCLKLFENAALREVEQNEDRFDIVLEHVQELKEKCASVDNTFSEHIDKIIANLGHIKQNEPLEDYTPILKKPQHRRAPSSSGSFNFSSFSHPLKPAIHSTTPSHHHLSSDRKSRSVAICPTTQESDPPKRKIHRTATQPKAPQDLHQSRKENRSTQTHDSKRRGSHPHALPSNLEETYRTPSRTSHSQTTHQCPSASLPLRLPIGSNRASLLERSAIITKKPRRTKSASLLDLDENFTAENPFKLNTYGEKLLSIWKVEILNEIGLLVRKYNGSVNFYYQFKLLDGSEILNQNTWKMAKFISSVLTFTIDKETKKSFSNRKITFTYNLKERQSVIKFVLIYLENLLNLSHQKQNKFFSSCSFMQDLLRIEKKYQESLEDKTYLKLKNTNGYHQMHNDLSFFKLILLDCIHLFMHVILKKAKENPSITAELAKYVRIVQTSTSNHILTSTHRELEQINKYNRSLHETVNLKSWLEVILACHQLDSVVKLY